MTVLQITVSAGYGGGPEHLYQLMSGLEKKGVKNLVVCPKQEPYYERYSQILSAVPFQIPERKFSLQILLKLRAFAKKNNVSVIHSHGKGAGLYARLLSLLTGITVVHTPHGNHVGHYRLLMKLFFTVYEWLFGWIPRTNIFVSQSEMELARSNKLPFRNGVVISNGIEDVVGDHKAWREEKRAHLELSEEDIVVSILSRFDEQKNMLEAVCVASELPAVKFLFIGDGEQKSESVQLCNRRGVKNIVFTGFVNDPIKYLAASDIYFSCSKWEGLPVAVIEAMSLSIPCVVSAVTGNSDAVSDGETGFYYQLGDVRDGAQKIARLVSDPCLRLELGQAGREVQLSKFSRGKMVDDTFSIYQSIIVN